MIRTLVVDDSPQFLVAAGHALARQPHLVLAGGARSGSEAQGQLERPHPDLVLLELIVPGMNVAQLPGVIEFLFPQVAAAP